MNVSVSHGRPLRIAAFAVFVALLFSVALSAQQRIAKNTAGSSSKPNLQFQEVEDLVRQGFLDQAKQKIEDALQRNPSSVEAYNLLGIICTELKDFPSAGEAFQRALKLDPTSVRTRNNLGNLYAAQGKGDLAEKEFRAVVRLDPGNRDGNYNLGLLLMAKNQPAEAILH